MISEGTSQLQVCLTLQDGKQLARFVEFSVLSHDGTAQAPEDYMSLDLDMRFTPSNGNAKCLQLTVVDDWRLEHNEVFSLTLTSSDPSISLDLDQAFIRIFDNDQVTIGTQQTFYVARETSGQIELIVELLGDIERDVSVTLESRDGTAIASDGDYIPFSEIITFLRGSTSGSRRSVRVYIQDDPLVERLEFFTVHTSSLDTSVQIQQGKEDVFIYIISDDGMYVVTNSPQI